MSGKIPGALTSVLIGLALVAASLAQDFFGFDSSAGRFVLNGQLLAQLPRVDCLALSESAVLRFGSLPGASSGTNYDVFSSTALSTPEQAIVLAWHAGEKLILGATGSGFELFGRPIPPLDGLHYGSLIVTVLGGFLLRGQSSVVFFTREGTVQEWTYGGAVLSLHVDPANPSWPQYSALDLESGRFYLGSVDASQSGQIAAPTSFRTIYTGGNALNSRPQILNGASNVLFVASTQQTLQLSSSLNLLLSRESVQLASSQGLEQPAYSVPVVITASAVIQLTAGQVPYFSQITIEAGSTLVLDLGGRGYTDGDTLTVFAYASAAGQFEHIELVNYASSSCLRLSAEGQLGGASYYVTFSTEISCTSAAGRLTGGF